MTRRKPRISRRQAMVQKWQPLYEVADRIQELAPWQWMKEDEIFGVQNPESGEIGFVSVMGTLGEHLSIAMYLGVDAITQFWALEGMADSSSDPWEIANHLLVIPQIQLSFENRDVVEKEDARIMRKLNLKYQGHQAYPVFRYIKPGCPMWFLEMEQIPFLTHALHQTVDVVSRYENDMSLLYPGDVDNNEMYLLRVAEEQDGELVWRDEARPIPEPEARRIPIDIDKDAFETLQEVPRVGNSIEIDLFMMPTPIMEKRGERPYYPFALLIVDADSGMVLSHDTLSPLPSLDEMYSTMPQKVMALLLRNNMMPYEIHTQSPMLTSLLRPPFEQLNTSVVERPFLPMANEAKAAMLEHLNRGFG